MENNIIKFNAKQEENLEKASEALQEQFKDEPLTDQEETEVQEMKNELDSSAVIIRDGNKEISFDDYVKPLDDAIPTLPDGTKLMSMTPGEKKGFDKDDLIKQFSDSAIAGLAEGGNTSEDEMRDLMHVTLAAIKKHLGVEKLRKDQAMAALNKCKLTELMEFLPRKLFDTYISQTMWKTRRNEVKGTILMVIDFMITAGPESDDFSEYMENQNKIYAVLQALAETNFKVKDIVESKEKFSEIAKKVLKRADPRMLDFAKYVNSPDSINLVFSQRAEINREFAAAYRELRNNYSDPVELETIDKEIDESDYKANMYESVLNLERFHEVLEGLTTELLNNSKKKASNAHSLDKLARKGLEKIKNANLEVPFPGYTGTEKNIGELYVNFCKHYRHHAELYNKFVDKINASENQSLARIENADFFCNVLLIVMGRIQKKLTKNTASYREMNELSIYFELMCRFCTDIFTTAKAVAMINELSNKLNGETP